MNKVHPKHLIVGLAVIAAVLYNSWVMGYILDPSLLHSSYFSALDIYGKPYPWVYTVGDILTGLTVLAVGFALSKYKTHNMRIIYGYITFGVATFVDAIIPISSRCVTSISACGISPGQILSPHDIASLVADFSLLYIVIICRRSLRAEGLNINIYRWLSLTLWVYCIAGIFLIMCVVINNYTLVSQALFLIACGLVLVTVPISLLYRQTAPKT